jgi:hypothetical protein
VTNKANIFSGRYYIRKLEAFKRNVRRHKVQGTKGRVPHTFSQNMHHNPWAVAYITFLPICTSRKEIINDITYKKHVRSVHIAYILPIYCKL